ncbi:MAG: hypothetical protein RMJ36_04470 [Candidatus Calescibacterium sp.]|nr:hypothetical protein [Candidatus Calescibacterium sp.]MDW8132889.1 hypothetical protein [Candidatus Calescibacterium sp.]
MYRILFFLVFFIIWPVFSQSLQKADLLYNDNKFSAYIINNTSYLSREDLSYIIGSPIKWDKEERTVIIDNMRIYTKILIYKGQMLLAIKEILVPLGYQIKWNQNTRTITIIPPVNKNKEHKANIKIEKNNTEKNANNADDKPREPQKYEIPFINNENNKEKSGVKPDQSLQIVFIPRSAFNEEYKVTVSDMKETKIYKGTYNAQSGYKFVVINVSQQNLSNKVQLYTGKFTLFDNRNTKYEYIEGLSSYVLQILMPMGINFGTLVFEIPEVSIPSKLVLETYGSTPIVINLL